jgi:hypothetical protein
MHGVVGAVVVPWSLCHIGVAVSIFAPCVVLWSSLRHVWCCRCHHCTACSVVGAVIVPWWCHGHSRCAACGVAVAVVMPHLVSWMLLSCCGGVTITVVVCVGVMVDFVPRVVLSRCVWYHGHSRCAVCGFVVTVVAPCECCRCCLCAVCGFAVTVVVPHVALWALSLCVVS